MGRSRDLADGTLAELNVDSNTLAVDATNNRVGIGTASPSTNLHVSRGSAGGGSWNGYTALAVESPNYAVISLKSPNANFSQILFADLAGTSNGQIAYMNSAQTNANSMQFYTNNAERMRIDSSGRVTMPYQPSFAAYRGSYSLPTQSWTTIVYDNCTLNRGSHYSTSTGRFTAPVAGYYYFEAIGEGGGGQFHTLIAVNGATPSGYADTAQNWTSSNVSRQALVVSLSANDYVFVQHYIDSGKTMTNNRSHFHGWLIG